MEWKTLADVKYGANYKINKNGEIMNAYTGKKLKPYKSGDYYYVDLWGEGGYKRYALHTLVCTAFHGTPKKGQIANHKDGNKARNTASNLEWATIAENTQHAYDNGLINK